MHALHFRRVRSAAVLALALVQAFPASVLPAQPPNTTYYAAIAFSQTTGRYGYSSGWRADSNARRDALRRCAAADAEVVLTVGNGYAALALGDDSSAYGYGYHEHSAAEAKRHALEACRARTTNCNIAVCVHSWAG